jgi:integrase
MLSSERVLFRTFCYPLATQNVASGWGKQMQLRFTDKAVASLRPNGKRYEVWDAQRAALGLRVGRSGKKSWQFVYHFEGRPRRLVLGQYPKISLADAGVVYAEAKRQLELGIDPGAIRVAERQRIRALPTIAELGEEYLDKHCRPNKRSWREDERIFRHDVLPAWAGRKASAVTRADVNALLDKIAQRAPIQANRTFAFIRAMFGFAESRDYITASPCHGVRARAKERTRDRVLEGAEIAAMWRGLDQPGISETVRLAIRFLLLTAQRTGEVVNAEWPEIDGQNAVWTLPGSKVKNGRPHRVPLSSQAVELLDEIKSNAQKYRGGDRLLFPSPRGDRAIGSQSLDRALRRLRIAGEMPDFRPHDLRRSAASHMSRLGASRLTLIKLLNHSDRSVTSVYDRYDYDQEKREAVERWGSEVAALVDAHEVRNAA